MEDSKNREEPEVSLSIITALYNCLELTREFLASLEATLIGLDLQYEVILVDDGSTDGTREYLQTLGEPYRVVLNEENLGFAGANNRGAALAMHPLLCFLNNDLVLQDGWLEPMLEALDTLPRAGIIGNVQLDAKTGMIDHAGVFFDHKGLPAHARKGRKSLPLQAYREWNAVTAACMLVRKSVFEKAGGFDVIYRNGTEDIDLCVQLKTLGYRHYVANHSMVHHYVSSSPGRTDYDDRNMQIFGERWKHLTAEWGKREWAAEYLRRYARRWWRYNFIKFWRAVFILIFYRRVGRPELVHRKMDT